MPPSRIVVILTLAVVGSMAVWPAEVAAQRSGVRSAIVQRVYIGPYGFGPVFGPRLYYPGYPPFLWMHYGPYPPYGWRRAVHDLTGSARLRVTPSSAEVYVNGYFAGIVDNFDGRFQRLHVPAGEHELAFYLDGYRTLRHKVLFRPGATISIIDALEPLSPGDTTEPRPAPDATSRSHLRPDRGGRRVPPYGAREQTLFGSLSIRVQPSDALVLVNGEQWDRGEGESRLLIELPDGEHRVEVRKDGYRTYVTTVRIRRGQTAILNVSLQ